MPYVGYGGVKIDPLRFLSACRKGRLNHALSVLSLCLGFFLMYVCCSDVNKDLGPKAKAKAKDTGHKVKAKAKALGYQGQGQGQGLGPKAKAKAKDLGLKAKAKDLRCQSQ